MLLIYISLSTPITNPDTPEMPIITGSRIFLVESTFVLSRTKQSVENQGIFSSRALWNRFCFLCTCGCVVAEKALKEIQTDECLVCGTKFEEKDVVLLNPSYALCFMLYALYI